MCTWLAKHFQLKAVLIASRQSTHGLLCFARFFIKNRAIFSSNANKQVKIRQNPLKRRICSILFVFSSLFPRLGFCLISFHFSLQPFLFPSFILFLLIFTFVVLKFNTHTHTHTIIWSSFHCVLIIYSALLFFIPLFYSFLTQLFEKIYLVIKNWLNLLNWVENPFFPENSFNFHHLENTLNYQINLSSLLSEILSILKILLKTFKAFNSLLKLFKFLINIIINLEEMKLFIKFFINYLNFYYC